MGDDRLVVVESMDMAVKSEWQKDLEQALLEFGWGDVDVAGLSRLPWTDQEQSKLVVMHALLPIGGKVNCGDVLCKRRRRICGPKD